MSRRRTGLTHVLIAASLICPLPATAADDPAALQRYQAAASHASAPLFPPQARKQHTYWTVIGLPAAREKSLFDEFGNLQPYQGAPMVQPVWRDRSGRSAAAHNARPTHSLREGYMPMPALQWSPQPGLVMRSEALAVEQGGQPLTLVRHRLRNTGSRPVDGVLSLVIRPVQVDPGGVSPIRAIAIDADTVRVDGRTLLQSLTPVDARGAAGFGALGEGEITRHVAAGTVPDATRASDDDGLAAALLDYRVQLAPGAVRDVVLAFPLGPPTADTVTLTEPGDASASFDRLAETEARRWLTLLNRIVLTLPDRGIADMLRAQTAHLLIARPDLRDAADAATWAREQSAATVPSPNGGPPGEPRDAEDRLRTLMRDRRPAGWQVLAEVNNRHSRQTIDAGDLPHSAPGAEYLRTVFGLLVHEAPDRLRLLSGTPPSWLARPGLELSGLPTAFGAVNLSARLIGRQLQIELRPGLRADAAVEVVWPIHQRPLQVWVDDVVMDTAGEESIRLTKPFARLVAQW